MMEHCQELKTTIFYERDAQFTNVKTRKMIELQRIRVKCTTSMKATILAIKRRVAVAASPSLNTV